MIIVGKGVGAEAIRGAHAPRARVPGTVHRPVHAARLPADVLHDVDFAARGPADLLAATPEHPERGPHTLPARDTNPCLDAAVLPRCQALGLEASRRVLPVSKRLLTRIDDEMAVFDARILGASSVELQLMVSPAAAAGLPDPFRKVQGRAVELVVPDEARIPARGRRRIRASRRGGSAHGERHSRAHEEQARAGSWHQR